MSKNAWTLQIRHSHWMPLPNGGRNRSSIFDMAMLQNYCFRPNLDGSWWININHFQCCDSIDTYGSPHSYKWQCYIPEIVDCMLYQVVGPPIYAQISPGSHTFVTSECILYIYIDSSLVESFFGWTYMPKFRLKNHGQDVIFVSFSFGQASRCRRHNGGLSGWWVVTWPESGSMVPHGVPTSDNHFFESIISILTHGQVKNMYNMYSMPRLSVVS